MQGRQGDGDGKDSRLKSVTGDDAVDRRKATPAPKLAELLNQAGGRPAPVPAGYRLGCTPRPSGDY